MASLSDNFNGIADGNFLDGDSNWASNLTSGARMQSDRHSDTDDGTQVMDGSGQMSGQQYAIYQTALDGEDHEVSLDCFPDSTASNYVGVLARCSSASDHTSPTCYRARFNTDSSGVLELHKVVSGVSTSLGTWTGYNNSTTTVFDLKLICDGSTISVEVDGTERISVTDTSITTGDYAGIYFFRQFAAADGQPWVDNWAAADLAGGAVTVDPDDADHGHTADQATVSVSVTVDPDDADHAHTADQATIDTTVTVDPDDAGHAHTADQATVSVSVTVDPDDADHAHTADQATITGSGGDDLAGAYATDTSSGQAIPTTSWATLDTGGTLVDSDGIVTEAAGVYTPQEEGYYLVEFYSFFTLTHNNRLAIECKIQRNDADYAGAFGSGYGRNTQNDKFTPDAMMIAHFNGSTDDFRIQHRRDTGAGTPAGSYTETIVKITLLATGAAGDTPFVHIGTPTGGAFGGTTPTAVTGWDSITESDDTVLEHVTGGVRIKETGRPILIAYAAPTDASGGSRTGRLTDLTLDGARINHSGGHCYQRDAANQYAVPNGLALAAADAVDEDVQLRIWGPSDPGWPTPVNGNWTLSSAAGRAGMMAIALPADTDYAIYEDTTAGQTFSGSATTDLEIFETEVAAGTAFSKSSSTELTTTADNVIAYGAYYVQRTSSSGSRQSNAVRWEVGGVDQEGKIDYLRGDQGTQDEPDGMYCTLYVGPGGTLNFEKYDPGSDDGANDFTQWGGAFVIDLATLAVSGGGGSVTVTADDALHGHTADQATVSVSVAVDPDDADHGHTADEPTVTIVVTADPDDSSHAHTADGATVSVSVTVDPDDATHDHTADQATVSVTVTVDPDDADHGHTADQATVSADVTIAPDDALHGHTADEATVTLGGVALGLCVGTDNIVLGSDDLVIAGAAGILVSPDDALHGHTADQASVSVSVTAAPDDATHGHTVDEATVAVSVTAAPDDATHGHTAGEATVTVSVTVAPDDALHGHTADEATVTLGGVALGLCIGTDNIVLGSDDLVLGSAAGITIDPDDATHDHTSSEATVTVSVTVAPDDATHGHTADQATIVIPVVVEPDDATHGHTADQATVTIAATVDPDSALHGHAADQATVTVSVTVDPDDALHAHTADEAAVTVVVTVDPDDALHGHTADEAEITVLFGPGAITLTVTAPDVDLTTASPCVSLAATAPDVTLTADSPDVSLSTSSASVDLDVGVLVGVT